MFEVIRKGYALLDSSGRAHLIALIFLVILAAILEGLGVGLIFPIIKILLNPNEIATIPHIGEYLAEFNLDEGFDVLVYGLGGMILFFIGKDCVLLAVAYFKGRFLARNQVVVSCRLLNRYAHKPYVFHLEHHSTELIRNTHNAVTSAFASVINAMIDIAAEILTATAIFAILFIASPDAAMGIVGVLVLGVFGFFSYFQRWMRYSGERLHFYNQRVLQSLQQIFGSIKEITIAGCQPHFESSYQEVAAATANLRVKTKVLQEMPRHFLEVVMVCAIASMVIFLRDGQTTNDDLVSLLGLFGMAAFRLMPSANRIILSVGIFNQGAAAIHDVHRDLISNQTDDERVGEGDAKAYEFGDSIELKSVEYSFPGHRDTVLKKIDLRIEKGEAIGVVGPSGAGKSTMIDIILGVLTPTHGSVLIDGAQLMRAPAQWQRKTGYVPQTIFLIDDTIRRNIAFGVDDQNIDDARVAEALKAANMDAVISDLPEGLDTVVGEGGVKLSGGQRQRLGIARALYRHPEVLILDEATSALDPETEKEISRAIESLRRSLTLIIIAHRVDTLRNCDRIVVLTGGEISEIGTFSDLARDNEAFRSFLTDGTI